MARNKDEMDRMLKAEERKAEQKLFRLMPGLTTFLESLGDRVENFDGKQPRTLITSIKGDFNALAEALKGRERRLGRLLWYLFGKLAFETNVKCFVHRVVELTKREAAVDDRYSLLLKLMHKADERIPLVSIIVFLRHGDPEATLPQQCAPVEFLRLAEKETGEARATTVLRALTSTAEFLYKPYLITIWSLSYLKEGKIPPQVPEFGDLVKAANRRLPDYPGLIELNAAWMRNAAVHNLPDYDFDADSLTLQDRRTPPVKVRVDDLLEMVKRMYLLSGVTISRVGQLYMFRETFVETGLLDTFLLHMPDFLSSDEARVAQAEQEILEAARTLVEPMESFFNSNGS